MSLVQKSPIKETIFCERVSTGRCCAEMFDSELSGRSQFVPYSPDVCLQCVCVYVRIRVVRVAHLMCMYKYVCMYVYIYVYVYVCLYVCIYVHIQICMYIYV